MKLNLTHLIVLVTISIMVSCKSKPVAISESQLLGDWQSLTDDQLMISFSISDSGSLYTIYTDEKIEKQMHWKLNGNKLLTEQNSIGVDEIILSLNEDTLIFNEGEEHFVKIDLQNEMYDDSAYQSFDILEDINDNLGSKFSTLEKINDAGLPQSCEWKGMSSPVILESDDLETVNETCEQIISLLTLEGFAPDSSLNKNKWLVYQREQQKIIIRYLAPETPKQGDTLTIEVLCGTR